MSKLIPISSKQMKAMGIVKSKNGYLMREHKPQTSSTANNGKVKIVKAPEPKKESRKEVKPTHKPSPAASRRIQQVEVVNKGAKQAEAKRMEDRGLY